MTQLNTIEKAKDDEAGIKVLLSFIYFWILPLVLGAFFWAASSMSYLQGWGAAQVFVGALYLVGKLVVKFNSEKIAADHDAGRR